MSDLKALIFDVDGTLAETERDGHRVAFNQAFAYAGLTWQWSEPLYGELLAVSGGKERIRYFIETYAPPLPQVESWSTFIAELHQVKSTYYSERLRQGKIELRPGVQRLISEAIAAQVRLAIATTSRYENAIALLETALDQNAPQWFEVIAAGDIVPNKKPASDIYNFVLSQLQLPAHQCVAIEDTEHGLVAATGVNITTVVTVNRYTQKQDFALAALVLSHLGDAHNPCQVLQGKTLENSYFDLENARSLLHR